MSVAACVCTASPCLGLLTAAILVATVTFKSVLAAEGADEGCDALTSSAAFSLLQHGRSLSRDEDDDPVAMTQVGAIAQLREQFQDSALGRQQVETSATPETLNTGESLASFVPQSAASTLFNGDWVQRWVPEEFRGSVDQWATTSLFYCSLGITHRSVVGDISRKLQSDRSVKQVEKKVQVQHTNVTVRQVPVEVNITQDRVIFQDVIKTVTKYVPVETVVQRNRTVEVPTIKEVVRNITKAPKLVMKEVVKKVQVNVSKPVLKEVTKNVTVLVDKPTYVNNTKKVKRHVEVPKVVKRQVEIEEVQIEEVLVEGNSTGITGPVPDQDVVEVEIPKVIIKEVVVPVNITRDVVKNKVIKQTVKRYVEKPILQVKRIEVEVPEWKQVIREVPMVRVEQRIVEVVKEELEIEQVEEDIMVTEEQIEATVIEKHRDVESVVESPELIYEDVEVPSGGLNINAVQTIHETHVEAVTNITQEVIEVEEEVEVVERVIEVYVDIPKVVQVPKYVTRNITKEVEIWTVREEIVQVPVPKVVEIITEVPVNILKNVSVGVMHEVVVPNTTNTAKEIVQEEIVPQVQEQDVLLVNLVPTPFSVSESSEDVTLNTGEADENYSGETLIEEIIVAEPVFTEVVQNVSVPSLTTFTREVVVPYYQIQEEIVEVPQVKFEDVLVEVRKVIEVETVVEVEGPEEVLEQEVIMPEYVEQEVVIEVSQVPQIVYEERNVPVQVYSIEEEIVEKEKVFYEDEIVRKNKTMLVRRAVPSTNSASNATNTTQAVRYVEKEVVREVQVIAPNYVDREVEVLVYEIEEEIVEVPKNVTVEEIVQVPRVIEIEKVVEVEVIEYNDTVREVVQKKRVPQKVQRATKTTRLKPVELQREVLNVSNNVTKIPFNIQVPKYVPATLNATQATTLGVLNVTYRQNELNQTKKVKVKTIVERPVLKTVKREKEVYVDVITEIVSETVKPIYKEQVKQKFVHVPVYTIQERTVEKEVTQEVVQPYEVIVNKTVDLLVETVVERKQTNVSVLLHQKPNVVFRNVSIPVPCSA